MSHQEHTPIATHGSALESRYAGENDTLIRMRHSAAHMMAEAVLAHLSRGEARHRGRQLRTGSITTFCCRAR